MSSKSTSAELDQHISINKSVVNTLGMSIFISGTVADVCSYKNHHAKPTTNVQLMFHLCFVSMENNALSKTWSQSGLEVLNGYCT